MLGVSRVRLLRTTAVSARRADQFVAVCIDHAEQAGHGEARGRILPVVAQPPDQLVPKVKKSINNLLIGRSI